MATDTDSTRTDKLLFTPGPLTTSDTVKAAMLRDLGSRDEEFIEMVRDVRRRLVGFAGASSDEYTAVLMQGSGTFGVEAVVSSVIAPGAKLLVVANGAYGRRIAQIAKTAKIPTVLVECPEEEWADVERIDRELAHDETVDAVAVVHCETTTGIVNPIERIGKICHNRDRRFIVDAMSSFGGMPIDVPGCHIHYLVSSANKCLEGVPGFSFAICRKDDLEKTSSWARSLSLDLCSQWRGLESNGQFRFTPPTHAILAFRQALEEFAAEGGVGGRSQRYKRNQQVLAAGMRAMGFEAYLSPEMQGPIITSFRYPRDPLFQFDAFYRKLSDRGFVIYPGKVSDADCFRIGSIGNIFESDVRQLLAAIQEVVAEMRFNLTPR